MTTQRTQPSIGKLRGALSGVLAGAAALSVGELVAALWAPRPGPVVAVANRVIEFAPSWFVDFGKAVFGLADKPALVLGTIIIALVFAGFLGIASLSNRLFGVAGITLFGVIGFLAIGSDPQAGWGAAFFFAVVAAVSGIGTLLWLIDRAGGSAAKPQAVVAGVTDSPTSPAINRRGFLSAAGVAGAGVAIAGVAGDWLRGRSAAEAARSEVVISGTASEAEVNNLVAAANAHPVAQTPGITPAVITGENAFYLIDTAVLKPQVDPSNWQLKINGMVDNPLTYSYNELLDLASVTAPVTLSCVSNEVGGGLVGNAVWQGVPLTELLDAAGVQAGATQIKSQSVDGWNCGFPTDLAFDGRTALVAVAMNGEPLPIRHGFPARLVVSGLYGYVSATKWLDTITLTTLEDFDGYWIPRGWGKYGPVKTQSRIDTPRRSAGLTAGETVPIAGVAWAPNTGVAKVEIQIDSEPWIEATLGESMGINSWRQWLVPWVSVAGTHTIRVRATDESGYTQTSDRAPVAPDGATGWHTIEVKVA